MSATGIWPTRPWPCSPSVIRTIRLPVRPWYGDSSTLPPAKSGWAVPTASLVGPSGDQEDPTRAAEIALPNRLLPWPAKSRSIGPICLLHRPFAIRWRPSIGNWDKTLQAQRFYALDHRGVDRDAWWDCARGEMWLLDRKGPSPKPLACLRLRIGTAASRRAVGRGPLEEVPADRAFQSPGRRSRLARIGDAGPRRAISVPCDPMPPGPGRPLRRRERAAAPRSGSFAA